jgi:hypothetical protein
MDPGDPMKRALSAVLIVAALTQAVAPLLAQQPGAPVVTITSMDRGSVRPFDRLVISGSGFQPESAAISVLFTPRQHGLPVVVPVFSATATQVEVIVPTFLDPVRSDFGFGSADVQVTRDHAMSSNVLTGLDVAPVPTLPASVGTGRVTSAFMRMSLQFLSAANADASPAERTAFTAFAAAQTALLAKVETVVANPASAAAGTTIDSAPFVIDGPMLRASDRFIAATSPASPFSATASNEAVAGRWQPATKPTVNPIRGAAKSIAKCVSGRSRCLVWSGTFS